MFQVVVSLHISGTCIDVNADHEAKAYSQLDKNRHPQGGVANVRRDLLPPWIHTHETT